MTEFRVMRKDTLVPSIIYLVIGLILVFCPTSTMRTIGYVFATLLLLCGILMVYRYCTKDVNRVFYGNELVYGMILVALSILIYSKVDSFIAIIPMFLGIVILTSGVSKLQYAIGLYRSHYRGQTALFFLAAVNIILGLVLLINPFASMATLVIIIGASLIFSGVTDLLTTVMIDRKMKKVQHMKEEAGPIDVEAREVDNKDE